MPFDELSLFGEESFEDWRKDWEGMPEFEQPDNMPYQQITVSFKCEKDVIAFGELIGYKFTKKSKSAWFPRFENQKPESFRYSSEKNEDEEE